MRYIARISSVGLSVCLAAMLAGAPEAACGDEPLEVGKELKRIETEYGQAYLANQRDGLAIRWAMAKRDEALARLIKQAEEARSQEHLPLSDAYFALRRYDDSAREARAAVAKEGNRFSAYIALIGALTLGNKLDEAEQAFRDAKAKFGDTKSFVTLHQTLASGYRRNGRDEEAIEHFGAALEENWPTVLQLPGPFLSGFRNQVDQMTSAGIRAKHVPQVLAIIQRLETQIAVEVAAAKKLEPYAAVLQSAKARLQSAAGAPDK
jgi:tetratricopeptide (TPR) repeat protein